MRGSLLAWLVCVAVVACGCSHSGGYSKVRRNKDNALAASCNSGVWNDCNELASRYGKFVRQPNGSRRRPDRGRSAELYERSCNGGNAEGCQQLGRLLERDRTALVRSHVPVLIQQACDLGSGQACAQAREKPAVARALALFAAACGRGDRASCLLTGGRAGSSYGPRSGSGAERRCSYVESMLDTPRPAFDVSAALGPSTIDDAERHHEELVRAWGAAAAMVHDIPRGELEVISSAIERCFGLVRSRAVYLQELELRIAQARRTGIALPPFFAEVAPYTESMWRLLAVHMKYVAKQGISRWPPSGDLLADLRPEDARRIMDDLAAIEASCSARLVGAGQRFPNQLPSGGPLRVMGDVSIPEAAAADPDVWCYVARERSALMTTALAFKAFIAAPDQNQLESVLGGRPQRDAARRVADMLAFERPVIEEATRWYQAAGLPLPSPPVPRVAAKLAELRTSRYRPASALVSRPLPHDLRVEQLARAALASIEPGVSVLASAMDEGGFAIVVDPPDRPVQRWRTGRLLVRRAAAPWCEEHGFSYVEPFSGGAYRLAKTVTLREWVEIVACP